MRHVSVVKDETSQCNVKEGKKVTLNLNIPHMTLSLRYKLRNSYSDPKLIVHES